MISRKFGGKAVILENFYFPSLPMGTRSWTSILWSKIEPISFDDEEILAQTLQQSLIYECLVENVEENGGILENFQHLYLLMEPKELGINRMIQN